MEENMDETERRWHEDIERLDRAILEYRLRGTRDGVLWLVAAWVAGLVVLAFAYGGLWLL